MSRVITRNAHARTHANSEATLPHGDPLIPPIPVRPPHVEAHEDNQEVPSPRNNAGGPSGPDRDPDPSDDGPDSIPDEDDRDERSTEEPNNDDPFEAHGGCKDEDPTPFKRQYLVVFVYVCFTLLLTSYCRIYAITAYLSV